MSSAFLSYAMCRGTIAFVWFYHGLIPKLLYLHEDELAMSMAAGFSRATAERLAMIGGVLEIVMSIAVLVFWHHRWPLLLTTVAMAGLLGFVVLVHPVLLSGAFNPVTTNVAVMALSIASLHLRRQVGGKR